MSISLLAALIPPSIYAAVNYIDKYLVSKYFRGGGVGALMMFSSIVGVFVALCIFIIDPSVASLPAIDGVRIMGNGAIYILAALPYFYAIQKDDVSNIIPLFQLTPVFSYFLEWIILGSRMETHQIIAGVVIMISAIFISVDISHKTQSRLRLRTLLLIALSSLLYAVNALFFKVFALETPFWTTSFYEYVGFALVAFVLFVFVQPYRKEFMRVIRDNKSHVLALNGVNEGINIVGKVTFNAISLLMPVTLVWILGGFQPVFGFVYGFLLTKLFPRLIKENIERRVVIQKLIAITAMIAATIALG